MTLEIFHLGGVSLYNLYLLHSQKFEIVEDAFSILVEKVCNLLMDCRAIPILVQDISIY